MTIETQSRVATYIGNGSTTVFPFNFPVYEPGDLTIRVYDTETGSYETLAPGSYTSVGIGPDSVGGAITYNPAGIPIPSTKTLIILRILLYTQDADIRNQSGFYPDVIERQLDRIVMQIQQIAQDGENSIGRSVRVPFGEVITQLPPKADRYGRYLGFSGNGDPIMIDGPTVNVITDAVEFGTVISAIGAAIGGQAFVKVAGYYNIGDAGTPWYYKVVNTEPTHAGKIAFAGGKWGELFGPDASVKHFGAVGNADDSAGGVDDSTAIENAFNWFISEQGATLTFPAGRYRITRPLSFDFTPRRGTGYYGEVRMIGSILPEEGSAAALTFRNVYGETFQLRVEGGGKTADYTEADPIDCHEAFRFENAYGANILWVDGRNYKGRVLRITSGTLNSYGTPSQLLNIGIISTDSSAEVDDVEATRMAKGVGQSFFIDTNMSAFGTIQKISDFFCLYGPVIEDTYDVTVHSVENLLRGNSGIELRGVISFWGGHWELGSELPEGTRPDLLRIIPSATGNPQQCAFEQLFLNVGDRGLYAENVGQQVGQGLSIKSVNSRQNSSAGVQLKNCQKYIIGQLQVWRDNIGLKLEGTSFFGQIHIHSTETKLQAVQIDSTVSGLITLTGMISGANTSLTSNRGVVHCDTVNPIYFENLHISTDLTAYAYKLVANNAVHILGGSVDLAGGAVLLNPGVIPLRCNHVRGWLTEWRGVVAYLAGDVSKTVVHGLPATPDSVLFTPRGGAAIAGMTVTNIGPTTFDIVTPAPAGNNVDIQWRAYLNYAG